MHRACLLALVLACAATIPVPEAAGSSTDQPPRAAVMFLPSPVKAIKGRPFLERIAAIPGLTAFGFVSAIQGSYSPEQVLLDVSAGSRTATALYDDPIPEGISLRRTDGGGEISGWPQIAARAKTPPAEVKPGELAQRLLDAGRHVGFAGAAGSRNREAIAAADRAGRVEGVSLGRGRDTAKRAIALWRRASFIVARLPEGGRGRAAVARVLAARRAQDLVLVMQGPSTTARRLLAAGAAGLSGGRDLRSASTRTDGLVVSTDIAPTVLDRLRISKPKAMSGEPIEASGDRGTKQLVALRKRLAVVGPRRWSVVAGSLLLAAALGLLASAGSVAPTARRAALAALWLPPVLLVTGAIAPPALAELAIAGTASAALALISDRLVSWPRAIAVPAAVSIGAHVLDLALGSNLIVRSLLGPNPLLGARFYGIGNELEITLAVTALLGLGGALAGTSRRTTVWGIAVCGTLVAFALSWGRLGADVGAALTLGVGVAAGAVFATGRGSWRTRAAIVLGAPLLALGLLAALDLATGGNSHFTRSVLEAGGLDQLGQVAQRRLELSYTSLGRGIIGPLVAVAAVAVALGIWRRRRLLAGLERFPALQAALYGALAAVIAGALTNDSGPVIFLIGATYLALAVGYVRAMPKEGAARPARETAHRFGSDHR